MPKLVATKSLSYATRRLLPGDSFEASARDARVLIAIGKAQEARQIGALPPLPADLVSKVARRDPLDHDDNGEKGGSAKPAGDKEKVAKLRADYQALVGKRPFPGWDAAELQRRIDEALAS